MVRVLLGHAAALLRDALGSVLAREIDVDVVADSGDVEETLVRARAVRPDVAVLDAALPGQVGIQRLCRRIREDVPECGILVLIDRLTSVSVIRGLARLAPKVGLVGTDASPADLVAAVRQMAEGKVVLDARIASSVLTNDDTNPLTEREREVLRLAVTGLPTKDIARRLHLSSGTVRNCLSRTLAKTNAHTRIEAIRVAQTSGWI